ncbi:diguanylate cyclase [Rosenbergiella epipactidis]|uniref:GGDEF domain-containing protein n=1 Tax=Rosenbergiella epipactidis TaxID=1544694 RepID=UPI002025CCC4|nr:sensor domain-containing diguanylate cyclase [Rosenbergiella epipactidis]MCL9668453.1 diguanylate cyclase [Rosenbergiella epipactidis]
MRIDLTHMEKIAFLDRFRGIADTVALFLLTFFLCYVSSHLRLPLVLSMFWIVNAVVAGIFVRYPSTHRPTNYLACALAMFLNDYLFSGWLSSAILINMANIIFIAVIAIGLRGMWKSPTDQLTPKQVLILFPVCLAASLLSGIWGGIVSVEGKTLTDTLLNVALWVSEQFSTGLMILPLILSFKRSRKFVWQRTSVLAVLSVPLLFLGAALVSGPGSIAFPLPVLIWCALVLPVFVSALVTFLVGILEIMMVYENLIGEHLVNSPPEIMTLVSIRLGVAAMVLTPFMVSVTIDAVKTLNRRLEIRANTDFLTQLLSRAGLFDKLNDVPLPSGRSVGMILFDIDYFKAINDNFGHQAGDSVLSELGYILRRDYKEQFYISRFGGEEFALIGLDISCEQLYQQAEALRLRVARHDFSLSDRSLSITISLGLEVATVDHDEEWAQIITRLVTKADSRLYLSKAEGRNLTTPDWSEGSPALSDRTPT